MSVVAAQLGGRATYRTPKNMHQKILLPTWSCTWSNGGPRYVTRNMEDPKSLGLWYPSSLMKDMVSVKKRLQTFHCIV